jgi:hypothetical protein
MFGLILDFFVHWVSLLDVSLWMKYNHNGEVIDEIRDLKEMNAGRKIQNTN